MGIKENRSQPLKGRALLNSVIERSSYLDNYLSKVISHSYINRMLICNPVISRNPFSSSLLLKSGNQGFYGARRQSTTKKVIVNLLKYYFKNVVFFFFFLMHFIAFKMSKLKCDKKKIDQDKPLIVIDTFTMIDKIYPKARFKDAYFGSLYKVMNKRNRQYLVLCCLFGDRIWHLSRRVQTYNILAEDGRNFITEFELMGVDEWIDLVKFILIYPFKVLKLKRQVFGEFDELFREEIIDTLHSVQFGNYVRYLSGRKMKKLTGGKLIVISWYENQVIDKLFFRGIRESGVESKIYGCQFYPKPALLRNLYPLTEEGKYGVIPDVIFVSGKYYLDDKNGLDIRLGVSPRYNYLFDVKLDEETIKKREGLLILLTYSITESRRIIGVVQEAIEAGLSEQVTIKFHPNHCHMKPFSYPDAWKYSEEDLAELCPNASIVVTSGSSAALEAAVMGCSVIIVGNDVGLTFVPMTGYGKGKIWDLAFDAREVKQSIRRLSGYRKDHANEIKEIAAELRDMIFTQATEEKYIELFEL
ncbi:MAG: hypothetical protein JRJ42_03630 [Deltaproteobacteria bacterium]|nr:hypothetical protein [Deltaproteobacteria bacterium]